MEVTNVPQNLQSFEGANIMIIPGSFLY